MLLLFFFLLWIVGRLYLRVLSVVEQSKGGKKEHSCPILFKREKMINFQLFMGLSMHLLLVGIMSNYV